MNHRALGAAAAAFLATTVCACGSGDHSASPRAPATTAAVTSASGPNAGAHHGGRPSTATVALPPPPSSTGSNPASAKSRPAGARPLARLAVTCRKAPRLSPEAGHGRAATGARAQRLSLRVQMVTQALGPGAGTPATEFLAPLRRALDDLGEAARAVRNAPGPRATHRLQQAVARENAAAQQIGVPECAFAAG